MRWERVWRPFLCQTLSQRIKWCNTLWHMILCAEKEFDGLFCAKLLSDLVQKMFRIWPRDIFQWGKKEICSSGKTERGTAKVVNSLSLARSVPFSQPSHLLASQSSGAGKPWKDPWYDIFLKGRWYEDLKNNVPECLTSKYTNTQIQFGSNLKIDPTCDIFWKGNGTRT